MSEEVDVVKLVMPFVCLGSFLSIFGGFILWSARYQKRTKGYYFYNYEAFGRFWDQYAAHPSVALKNIDSTTRGGTIVSHKIRWMKLNVYINKIGVFYFSSVRNDQTYGSLMVFDEADLDRYDPRLKIAMTGYDIQEDILILKCQRKTPFGKGSGQLALRGISSEQMANIQSLLRHHFDAVQQS